MTPAYSFAIWENDDSGCYTHCMEVDYFKNALTDVRNGFPWGEDSTDYFWNLINLHKDSRVYSTWKIDRIIWLLRNQFDIRIRFKASETFQHFDFGEIQTYRYAERCRIFIDIMNEDQAILYRLQWGSE